MATDDQLRRVVGSPPGQHDRLCFVMRELETVASHPLVYHAQRTIDDLLQLFSGPSYTNHSEIVSEAHQMRPRRNVHRQRQIGRKINGDATGLPAPLWRSASLALFHFVGNVKDSRQSLYTLRILRGRAWTIRLKISLGIPEGPLALPEESLLAALKSSSAENLGISRVKTNSSFSGSNASNRFLISGDGMLSQSVIGAVRLKELGVFENKNKLF
ncbi:hypothetical protein AGLY_008774 [Aphis glycines]|uniref:Uncharacterized protein n=1 Tax=Aphis glycines TaxID=307491 RepID=A0A6G0TK46_APHGL|nr:hypothetical protein AGLY_008774 [Aphis glycines]